MLFRSESRWYQNGKGNEGFADFIEEMGLRDLPMVGRSFTWASSERESKWSRLDRFLIKEELLEKFKWKQWGLSQMLSDHCLVLLSGEEKDWGPKPFRVLDIWINQGSFKEIVRNVWSQSNAQGWKGYVIVKKMQALKQKIKEWNKNEF